MVWLNHRKTTITALGLTIAVCLVLSLRLSTDSDFLSRYGVSPSSVQTFYLALLIVLVPLTLFEPVLHRWLRQPPIKWFVIGVASITAFFSFQMVIPLQEKRLFDLPFSLWLLLVHIIALCALAVMLVTDNPGGAPDHRVMRTAGAILAALGLITAALYVASVGEFVRIDTPDEP